MPANPRTIKLGVQRRVHRAAASPSLPPASSTRSPTRGAVHTSPTTSPGRGDGSAAGVLTFVSSSQHHTFSSQARIVDVDNGELWHHQLSTRQRDDGPLRFDADRVPVAVAPRMAPAAAVAAASVVVATPPSIVTAAAGPHAPASVSTPTPTRRASISQEPKTLASV